MGRKTYLPPHGVTDREKFAAIVESFRLGRSVPPVAVCHDVAFTGSHRIAAYDVAHRCWDRGREGWEDSPEPVIETIEVSDDDYLAACRIMGLMHHQETHEFDQFAAALYCVTDDDDLKTALEDQRCGYETWTADDFAELTGI